MEAAVASEVGSPRELSGDKAARIVEAMRVSVAARGIAGATFDQVARAAGVSRGLLHYYFGTKERLLVEVVRRECEVRIDRVEQAIGRAGSADDVLAGLVQSFQEFLGEGPATSVMFHEIITLSQRNDGIAAEVAELGRRIRTAMARALRAKADAGVLELVTDEDTITIFLFALADGLTMRRLMEPDLDLGPVMEQSIAAARALLR